MGWWILCLKAPQEQERPLGIRIPLKGQQQPPKQNTDMLRIFEGVNQGKCLTKLLDYNPWQPLYSLWSICSVALYTSPLLGDRDLVQLRQRYQKEYIFEKRETRKMTEHNDIQDSTFIFQKAQNSRTQLS